MSRLTVIAAMFLGLLFTCEAALGVDLWYDFEGDSGTTASDKYTADGAQNGELLGNTTIDSFGAIWGTQAAFFDIPDPPPPVPPYSTLEIPFTTFGADFSLTVAGFMDNREDPLDFTRVFSSYRGTGPVGVDRIIFDVDATGGAIPGMRAIINNTSVVTAAPPPGLLDPGYHHYAMTVNAGDVRLFLDGSEVANGNVGSGYTNEYNIYVGEDPHDGGGGANEQLIGNFDEVLVINRALSAGDIATLAGGATVSSVVTPQSGETAVYYDFEGDSGQLATDKFAADGSQNGFFTLNSSVDPVQANARLGSRSGTFDHPNAGMETDPFSQINVGAVGNLGSTFTLSATVNMLDAGYTGGGLARLFSTFKGSGPPGEGELIFDVNPDADVSDVGMRLLLPGGSVTASNTFTLSEDHTMTAVYDNGTVTLYLDGVAVATDTVAGGDIDLLDKDLRIGEDTAGAVNENFLGNMDDILVLSRALTPQEVMDLHTMGASVLPPPPVGFEADFDRDGNVDGDDFLLWQNGFGTPSGATKMDGDYDNDGDVDGDDFLGWQAQFGLPDGGQGAGAVPEPTSLVLLLCLIAGGLAFRRKLAG